KGNQLVLSVTATGPAPGPAETVTVYFNGTGVGNSYLDIPTDTIVDISWLKTYNQTDQETATFTVGEFMQIRAEVTDPFGTYDISGATIKITAPNNTNLVDDLPMTLEQIDISDPSVWKLYNFTFDNPTVSGIYTIEITAIESNNVTSNDVTVYFLEPDVPNQIIITSDPSTIIANGNSSSNLELWIYDSYGNPIPGLEGGFKFSFEAGNGSFGAVYGYGDGHYNVTFTSPTASVPDAVINISVGDIFNFTTIILEPGPLHHIIVTPQTTSIIAGKSQNFGAKGYDLFNNELPLIGTAWTTTIGTVGSMTDTNADLIAQTTVANGYVNATIGITVGSADIEILPDQLARINITPSSANVTVNQLQDFDAIGYDQYENVVELTNTMWSTNVGIIQEQNNDNAKFKAQSIVGSGYVDARNGTIAKGVEVNVVPDILFIIILTPDPVNVTAGGSQDFTAVGYDKYNNMVPIALTWTSNVGTMDGSTLNARSKVGSGYVNATVGSISASATVYVIPSSLDYIIVSPSSMSIEVGKTSGFSAIGYDRYNNIVPIEPVWTSTVGIMAGPLFTAQSQVVKGYVNATVAEILGSATVTLIPGPLHHITVTPEEIEVITGATLDFEAAGNDQYDNFVPINPVWYTNVGTMASNKLYAQTNIGTGTVTATYIGIDGNANVTIIPDALSYLYVAPPYVEIIIGQSHEFTAIGYDKYNNIMTVIPTWSTNVGYMSGNIFTAQSLPGTGIVTAMVELNTTTQESIYGEAEVVVILGDFSGRPRIIGEIPDQDKYEDCPPWVLFLTPYESDDKDQGKNLRWEITNENTSLYLLSGELSDDDILKFTPRPNVYGSDQVTIWLIDSDGYKDFQTFWINLTPVNDKPVIYGAPDLILHYDDSYSFSFEPYIYDVDTPMSALTLSTYETTDEKYTTVSGFLVTFNYPQSLLGQEIFVTITVFDGDADSEDVIKVTVTDDWVPELVEELHDVVLYEGDILRNVFDLDDHFSDPDKDCLYYSFGETHVNVTIHDDHSVDIASISEWSGKDTVTFRAEDPVGALAEDTIIVIVLPKNDPPRISNVPDLVVRHDYDFEFDLSSYISDVDNDLDELIISTSEPKYISFNDKNKLMMIINFPELMKGRSIAVTITVSDGIESSSQAITVKVTDNYPPEIRKHIPDIEFDEDKVLKNAFDLDDYFIDMDGDILSYRNIDTEITVTIHTNNTVDFAAPNNWFGKVPITFRASDRHGGLQEDTIIATVIPINDAPNIKTIGDQTGEVGQLWVLDLSEYISDVESNITELEISIESDYITISGLNLIFYSDMVDSQEVMIEVNDGEQKSSFMFNLTFVAGEEVIPLSELVYWSIIIIILVIIISLALVYKRYSGKYSIEEIFLINKDGTLLAHKASKKQSRVDDDILSGMLTAIQSFVKESFGKPRSSHTISSHGAQKIDEWELQQLKVQGHDLLIEHGKYTYLAVLYSGKSGWKLIRDVRHTLVAVEDRYAYVLEHWDGCMNRIAGVEKLLDPLVSTENPINKNFNFKPKLVKK
ncbi:MAG: cadherin-like domain-containing protein, partial [Thermoplasmata archaeon]|nr:cadherin-like domain-containing protein [Thermoplasmata archaeon]